MQDLPDDQFSLSKQYYNSNYCDFRNIVSRTTALEHFNPPDTPNIPVPSLAQLKSGNFQPSFSPIPNQSFK